MKLTPTDKLKRAELLDITRAKNRALSALSFKHIKTYEDFLVSIGHNREILRLFYHNLGQLSTDVLREDIIAYFRTYEVECEQRYAGVYDNFKYEFTPHEYEGIYYDGTTSSNVPANIVDSDNISAGDTLSLEETLPESPLQTCKLFAFQERAACALYYNIIHKGMRGQLLRAAVGTGKTFIIGAVIRRLLDIKFTDGKTYSPWPIVYVTKASIVAQTERVLQNHFGIDTVTEVKVINIEQLRATFGELMVRWETVVIRGEEHPKWVWRPGVHPCLFLIDECQVAKNNSSQQAQIIQSISEIESPDVYCIFFSATPFMTVEEAKAFVLNLRMNVQTAVA